MSLHPKQMLPRRKFSPEEDHKLRSLVDALGTKSWEDIARYIPDRSSRQCRDRYKNYLLESLMADPWTPEEDALVIQQFHLMGPKWVEIGKMLSGRSGNNVKNRWHKHLCRLDSAVPRPPAPNPAPVPTPANADELAACEEPVGEFDWPGLFNPLDTGFSVDRSWNGGFSVEDSLF
jgi:hypothetical protein